MKLLVSKKLNKDSHIFPVVLGMLLFFIGALVLNTLFMHMKISLIPSQAAETIFGNEESFLEPILFEELAFIVHMEFFFFMIVTLLSFFVHYRLFKKRRSTKRLIMVTFLIQASLLSLLFAPMGSRTLIYIFTGGFCLSEIFLLYIIAESIFRMYKNG